MDLPVYKLFFSRRSARALALPPGQLQSVMDRVNDLADRLHVRLLLVAEMRWSNEQYEYFGVEQFPSLAVEQEYTCGLEKLDWYALMEGESYLGMPLDGTANEITFPDLPPSGESSIYRVYLSRLTTYGLELDSKKLEDVWALGRDSLRRAGGVPLLAAYMRWNNETWDAFGIERFPSGQAVLSYSQYLTVSGWYRVSAARSHLGVAAGGLLCGSEG